MQVSEAAKFSSTGLDSSLQQLLQSSADGFLCLDAHFRIHFANRSAVEFLSLPEDQVVGANLSELFQVLDIALISETLERGHEFAAECPARASSDGAAALHLRVVRMDFGYGVWLRPGETERERELQQRLTALDAQANAVTDSMSSALVVADSAGKVLKINPKARELFGAPNAGSLAEHVADFRFTDIQGNRLARAQWPLERALRGETVRDLDICVQPNRPGSREPWIACFNTSCFYDDSGRLQYVVALIRDVTGLRETERALNESEDRHTAAMEAAHLGTWNWDIKRNQLHWSDRCRVLYGVGRGAPVSVEAYRACIHPADRERVQLSTADSLARPGELIQVEYRVCWPDGSVHWLQSWKQSRLGRDGKPDVLTGVVVDIDERKAVEEELHRTAGALRTIIDGSPMGIVATDAAGAVTIWNAAAEQTLGFTRDAVIGKASPLVLGPGSLIHDREHRVLRSDGREIEVLCSVAAIDGKRAGNTPADEQANGSIAMFLDITERQRLRRRAEHVQKMESLSVLAGGVAHDFNNLLTGILGNASLCLYALDEQHENYELLQEILRAGDRAAALTRQLLAFTGQGRFSLTPLNLGDLARNLASHAQLPGRRMPISIQLDLENRLPFVEADSSQLQQVLLSLIVNSAEAIDGEQTGTIWIRTRTELVPEGSVAVGGSGETLPAGRYAVLEVEDTGAGMDAQTLARIFEPFFSTKFTGRGLGLPAVLGIVRQHRGAITVESAPGHGSIFRVHLPIPDYEPASILPHSDALSGSGQILVVDDEETVRTTIRRSLEHWGYQVVVAENGQAAVDVFPKLAPELRAVFLDLTMPVMGGEEALGHFRRIKPNLPVILISGFGEVHGGIRTTPDGPSSFLQKPFTPEQLSQKLFEVLER